MRGLVQHAIDVGMALLGTEFFGKLHGFIDRDPVRYIGSVEQFVGGDPQDGALYRIQLLDWAVEVD